MSPFHQLCIIIALVCLVDMPMRAKAYQSSEICSSHPESLASARYAPESIRAAKDANSTANQAARAPVGISFKFEGNQPCSKNSCRLLIFSNEGHDMLAAVHIGSENVTYCHAFRIDSADQNLDPDERCRNALFDFMGSIKIANLDGPVQVQRIYIQYYYFVGSSTALEEECPEDSSALPYRAHDWIFADEHGAMVQVDEVDYPRQFPLPAGTPFAVHAYGSPPPEK